MVILPIPKRLATMIANTRRYSIGHDEGMHQAGTGSKPFRRSMQMDRDGPGVVVPGANISFVVEEYTAYVPVG